MSSYGFSIWYFYLSYGCITEQAVHSSGLGTFLFSNDPSVLAYRGWAECYWCIIRLHHRKPYVSLFELLNNKLRTIMDDIKAPFLAALTQDVHVLPDFHGNRSPAADPKAKGIICGMTLDTSDSNWLFHTLLPCRVLHMVHAILWRIAMLMVTQDELRIRWLVYVLIQHLDEEKDWELVSSGYSCPCYSYIVVYLVQPLHQKMLIHVHLLAFTSTAIFSHYVFSQFNIMYG
ncbi:uncharacterized protein LOC107261557 isoform X2 [Ricinus communis]|uniref:uncharacterized protein LOC107261557 isoform X2 n=1 Tax=Ricinus communis TaxID=3988 RepID=UPI00201B171D|nr:uncharacterized protein LOC107261557 isoform X2 [Ricinus communis]